MAIQTSLRVRKTFANILSYDTNSSATNYALSRLVMVFVKDSVSFPTTAAGMSDYLNAVLNYSPNYGGGAGNRANLLAWTMVMPGTTATGATSPLGQTNDISMLTANRVITPINTGRVGSVIVFSPHVASNSATSTMSATVSGYSQVITGVVGAAATSISVSLLGIPEAATGTTGTTVAPGYFGGVHFVTDSVGVQSSSACVKLSTLDLVSGTPFTSYGYSLKTNLVS